MNECEFKYRPPCRITLGSTILDAVHQDIITERKRVLENTDSVLIVDGWKNKAINRKFLTFTLRNCIIPQTFLTFRDTSIESEDGDSLAANINAAIKFAEEEYKTKVYAIITDNDSKIKCGASRAETVDSEKLWQTTCSSHSGNLLLKSFAESSFMVRIRNIVKEFRDPRREALLQTDTKDSKLQNWPDTRFCYLRKSCLSIKKNLPRLRELCNKVPDLQVDQDVKADINDKNFENEIDEIIDNIDPICKLIDKWQGFQYNIADATEDWLKIELPTENYNHIIKARIEKAVHEVGFAANILHPKYKGSLLATTQKLKGTKFINEHLDDRGKEELRAYNNDSDQYMTWLTSCSDSRSYWGLCRIKYPNLAAFATKLMLIPASTASIEALFSEWTYVHTLTRNRLGLEKTGQLIDIYHSLRHWNNESMIL